MVHHLTKIKTPRYRQSIASTAIQFQLPWALPPVVPCVTSFPRTHNSSLIFIQIKVVANRAQLEMLVNRSLAV